MRSNYDLDLTKRENQKPHQGTGSKKEEYYFLAHLNEKDCIGTQGKQKLEKISGFVSPGDNRSHSSELKRNNFAPKQNSAKKVDLNRWKNEFPID